MENVKLPDEFARTSRLMVFELGNTCVDQETTIHTLICPFTKLGDALATEKW